jgi:hypothetical protein
MQDESESLLDSSTSAGQQVWIILKCEFSFTPNYPLPPPCTAELILDEENEDSKRKREIKTAAQKG